MNSSGNIKDWPGYKIPGRPKTRHRHIGARYEICNGCGREWNISIYQQIPFHGYLCPHCRAELRRARE